MRKDFVFTSESVTEGHPDKLCDQISDAMVDRFLQQDPLAMIDAECALAHTMLFIGARFASTAVVDMPQIAREVIGQVGYNDESLSAQKCTVLTSLKELPLRESFRYEEEELSSAEIDRLPAHTQVNAFGYACNQTAALMPLPIWLAHQLARRLAAVRIRKVLPYLAPDGKSQVGIQFRDREPERVFSLSLQACLDPRTAVPGESRLRDEIREAVIEPVFAAERLRPDNRTRIWINADDPLLGCGPGAHSGLTGRKNAIDTYGEFARHSGSALSGKDPSRIDRIGAYAARYAAKNVVAAGVAEECEIQLSYAVGLSSPLSIQVETFGTGRRTDEEINALLEEFFDFRPAAIIKQFKLRRLPRTVKGGFYRKLGAYGQVGRMDIGLPWEVTDKAPLLRGA
jgi:S-adenosylmethionine synthetase